MYAEGMENNDKPLAITREFTNERDANKFAASHGGPVHIHVERISRGRWFVDISAK